MVDLRADGEFQEEQDEKREQLDTWPIARLVAKQSFQFLTLQLALLKAALRSLKVV